MSARTPWRRRGRATTDDRLDMAAKRGRQIAQEAADAHEALDEALQREARQRRLNHLGMLAHDALMTPGRHKHP